MALLRDFELWFQSSFVRDERHPPVLGRSGNSRANPSAWVDLTSDDVIGRFTLWESGEAESEIATIQGVGEVVRDHLRVSEKEDLESALAAFVQSVQGRQQ